VQAPLFLLLTDFGAGSGYPAQMKGVLLSGVPGAGVVDLSHEVAQYDVLAGALLLEATLPWFPGEAIAIAVVDPGVGTSRRALCVVDAGGRRILAPDNGLATPFLGAGARAWAIEEGRAVPPARSATFHGRDLFAPAAVYLARGGDPGGLGAEVTDPVRLDWPAAQAGGGEVRGTSLAADPFGNLVTSIRAADLRGAAVREATAGGHPARWVRTFGDGAPGELLAMIGSGGRVEIAVREGSAAARLGAVRGIPVRLVLASG
jgi:S-adenosyl-L-methionine hydrolase (adenosine-forming)